MNALADAFKFWAPAGHYRVEVRTELRNLPSCDAHHRYLYLFMYPTILKIGVSRSPWKRSSAFGAREGARDFRGAYVIYLERAEAFRRENSIKTHFGSRYPSAPSEWLACDHAPEITLVMRRPEFADILRDLRDNRRWFWERGDARFESLGEPLKKAGAA